MSKEIPAFLRAEIGNDATDPTQEARDGRASIRRLPPETLTGFPRLRFL
jgi:hypothetical protein